MKCNPDDYREDLASFNLTIEQENDVLFTLWEMMRTFAEMGQGVQGINNIFPHVFDNNTERNAAIELKKDFTES